MDITPLKVVSAKKANGMAEKETIGIGANVLSGAINDWNISLTLNSPLKIALEGMGSVVGRSKVKVP